MAVPFTSTCSQDGASPSCFARAPCSVRSIIRFTAFELEAHDAGYLAGIGPRLLSFFGNRNLLLRPLGNTIYVMPPYCVTQADLDEIYAAILDAAGIMPTRESF
jgi:adenosylmethionine---8-amino-7-oxononanoate aminotransferase